MKILFVVSECVPFIKTGGLADVAGSLPKELKKLGTDIRVILPKYGAISSEYKNRMEKVTEFQVQIGWRRQYCGIEKLYLDGVTYYFVDNQYYFYRQELYGYGDDAERFAFFTRAVLDSINKLDFYPDILHCHDWHTGMIPFLYKVNFYRKKGYGLIKTVFTIHNLQFQGIFPPETLEDLFDLSGNFFNSNQLEFFGNVNFMKAAIVSSDSITTVSNSYMEEIQSHYFGEKLDGLLRKRNEDLEGILNGIDYTFYDPTTDPVIENYGINSLHKKATNKMKLQRNFGLPENNVPIIAMVTRFTKQKGLELVRHVLVDMLEEKLQFIILGNGDQEFEEFFRSMEVKYPDKCRAIIGFNEDLAHQIYASADLFLMPSKFEPCGLGQMIAMRYGTVPIVRETGGLKDTIKCFNPDTGEGNGFSFANFNAHEMLDAVRRALSLYESPGWENTVLSAMKSDFSWGQSAYKYNDLYSRLKARSESHVF